jgi:hypothetical protein
MRAARIGLGVVRVGSGRVLHFEHRSSTTVAGIWEKPGTPAKMSDQNQQYLAGKHNRQQLTATSPFLFLADANELCADPTILQTFGAAFTAQDAAALVIVGLDGNPTALATRIEATATVAGFDMSDGPRLILMTPSHHDDDALMALSDEVYARIGAGPAHLAFVHLGTTEIGDPEGLRAFAAGAWRARPFAYATSTA